MYSTLQIVPRAPKRLLLAIAIVALSLSSPAVTRAQAGQSRNSRDTLPANVARRALEAYSRNDLPAFYASYDSVVRFESLSDSTKRFTGPAAQAYASLPDYFAKNKIRVELKQQIVSGPFVVVLYDFIENGKRTPHLEIFDVRHGKIVHDWDQ